MLAPNAQPAPSGSMNFAAEPASPAPTGAPSMLPGAPAPQDIQMQGAVTETSDPVEQLTNHLNNIPDEQKAFLAEHLTPEFVYAIGIINGPEVAKYLGQFVDPNKVLVPVPREIAEQYRVQMQGQSAQQSLPQPTPGQPAQMAPQGAPPMAPPSAAPPGGMMQPTM